MFRWAARAAGALVTARALAAPATVADAAPGRASGVTTVVLGFGPGGGGAQARVENGLYTEALRAFEARNPDVRVQLVPGIGSAQLISDVASGSPAPDITGQYELEILRSGGVLLDLSPYVHEYNVDFSVWNGVAQYWRMPDGVWGVPERSNPFGMVANLEILDSLGLKYPPLDWTYTDALRLWRAATTNTTKGHVYGGGVLEQSSNTSPVSAYLHGFGASYTDPADLSRCRLDTPEAIAAGEWFYGAILDRIAEETQSCLGHQWRSQNAVMDIGALCALPQLATQFRTYKWDFWTQPTFPKGSFYYAGADGWVITNTTRHPEAAFRLLYWLATDPGWIRMRMRATLTAPSVRALFPEFLEVLGQVAPPLRGKNLAVLQTWNEHIQLDQPFQYNSAQALALIESWSQKILARQVTVAEGFREAARQVNAFEAEAKAASPEQARVRALLAHAAKANGPVTFPAPALAGMGGALAPAAPGAVTAKGGVYTIVGRGTGINQATLADSLTLACAPWTSSEGTFTCRLASIESVGGPPATAAKIGLMARADLGSGAPLAAVAVAIDRGVHFYTRVTVGDYVTDATSGQQGIAGLLQPSSAKASNYLVKPVWLRLARQGTRWSASSSFDGRNWLPLSAPYGVEMAGCWVGIWVSVNGGPPLRCAFDHVSLTPTASYQLGA